MSTRVADGVWWLHGTRGSNVFAVEDGEELVLIDTGFSGNGAAILGELAALAPGKRLTTILLTHAHRDHSGSAAELREASGARVVAGADDTRLDGSERRVLALGGGRHPVASRLARAIRRRPLGTPHIEVDQVLQGERELRPGLRAVPVPGHTPGSYCYVLSEREVAFVGDLVIGHHDGLARPLALTNSDDALYLASLRAFAEMAPRSGCPGHGDPVQGTFADEMRELASLPRRHILSPGLLWWRVRRFRRFMRRIARRRLYR